MGRCCFCCLKKTAQSKRTFHRFPLGDLHRLEQWMNNIPIKGWTPSKDSVLCSDHFTEDCFDRTGFKVHLNRGGIPTEFNNPKSFCVYCKIKRTYKSGLSFFRFPLENPTILKMWLENMHLENWVPMTDSRLCSNHFEPACFRVIRGKRKILKNGSLPTLFASTEIDDTPRDTRIVFVPSVQTTNIPDISTSTQHDDCEIVPESHLYIPMGRKSRFTVDHDHCYIDTSKISRRKLGQCREALKRNERLIKAQKQQLRRLEEQVTSLKDVIASLHHDQMVLNHVS